MKLRKRQSRAKRGYSVEIRYIDFFGYLNSRNGPSLAGLLKSIERSDYRCQEAAKYPMFDGLVNAFEKEVGSETPCCLLASYDPDRNGLEATYWISTLLQGKHKGRMAIVRVIRRRGIEKAVRAYINKKRNAA